MIKNDKKRKRTKSMVKDEKGRKGQERKSSRTRTNKKEQDILRKTSLSDWSGLV